MKRNRKKKNVSEKTIFVLAEQDKARDSQPALCSVGFFVFPRMVAIGRRKSYYELHD